MAYAFPNFKTKKELIEAVKNNTDIEVTVMSGLFHRDKVENGRVTIEGPHYPEAPRWFASGVVENGRLVKVS